MVQSATVEDNELVQNKVPPLLEGKSFIRYRDVNKAIEKHREMFGLRLALKRAVKLENYCLTVEQMKDLNLKLKYGELDYHCFVATGRPGRPGNDERCPQLVRLKLSPDAQSLIVYESHNHILPTTEGTMVLPALKHNLDLISLSNSNPVCLKGEITVTRIGPVQKNPILILPKPIQNVSTAGSTSQSNNYLIKSNNSFTSLIPISSPTSSSNSFTLPTDSEHNSVTITPSPIIPLCSNSSDAANLQDGHEKITVKIKKSECVPNEMVVVGSLRHAQEQQISKGPDETFEQNDAENMLSPTNVSTKLWTQKGALQIPQDVTVSPCNTPPNITTAKIKTSPSFAGYSKLFGNHSPNINLPGASPHPVSTIKPVNVPKSANNEIKAENFPKAMKVPTASQVSPSQTTQNKVVKQTISPRIVPTSKPTVLKQSANMKQIIVDKPSHKYVAGTKPSAKPAGSVKPVSNVCYQPSTVKQVNPKPGIGINSKLKQQSKTTNPSSCGKISSTVSPEGSNKSSDKLVVKQMDKQQGSTTNDKTPKTSNLKQNSGGVSNGPTNQGSGGKLLNIPKKLRKKPGRPPDSSYTNITTGSLDTELGYGEKQHLAHGVLLQLLRVTSQLPMVEFSHALDTLEVLTDAFRLGQRVSLSIRHDQDELSHNSFDDYFDMPYQVDEREFSVSSTTDDHRLLADVQVDGQLDANELLKSLASLNSIVPNMNEDQDELMEIEPPKEQIVIREEIKTTENKYDDDAPMACEGVPLHQYLPECNIFKGNTVPKDHHQIELQKNAKTGRHSLPCSKTSIHPDRARAHKRALSFSSSPDAKRYKQ